MWSIQCKRAQKYYQIHYKYSFLNRLSNQQANKSDVQSFGAILLFEESSYARGISKKNGKPWSKVGIMLSDGYQTIECVDWNGHKALSWPKNSLVFVVGKISNGWKTNVSMNISSIEKIQ